MRKAWSVSGCLLLLAALFLAGCPERTTTFVLNEVDEPQYRRGEQMLRAGRHAAALEAFLKVIEKRGGNAPESHLQAGELFLLHEKEPISAIYHYRRFMEARPNSPQADVVRQRIDTAIKEFARMLPGQPFQNQVDVLEMRERLEALEAENTRLRAQLAAARGEPAPSDRTPSPAPAPRTSEPAVVAERPPAERVRPTSPEPAPARTLPPGTRRYIVQPGDTLFRISVQAYGTGNRWQDILEANRAVIPNPNNMRVGTELILPP